MKLLILVVLCAFGFVSRADQLFGALVEVTYTVTTSGRQEKECVLTAHFGSRREMSELQKREIKNLLHKRLIQSPTCNKSYLPEDLAELVLGISDDIRWVKFSTNLRATGSWKYYH